MSVDNVQEYINTTIHAIDDRVDKSYSSEELAKKLTEKIKNTRKYQWGTKKGRQYNLKRACSILDAALEEIKLSYREGISEFLIMNHVSSISYAQYRRQDDMHICDIFNSKYSTTKIRKLIDNTIDGIVKDFEENSKYYEIRAKAIPLY